MNSLAMIRSALCETPINYNIISDALKLARPDEEEMLVQYLASHVKDPPPAWIAGERKVFEIDGIEFPMCWIPAGKFCMGSDDDNAEDDEKPRHEVTITRGFWMGETPVTQWQYSKIATINPLDNHEDRRKHPASRISWESAAYFTNMLSKRLQLPMAFDVSFSYEKSMDIEGVGDGAKDYLDSKGFRLPTEAEWEYACRAGTTGDTYGDLDKISWHIKNTDRTRPVYEKEANAWGLYDMIGNVDEWCYDMYYENYPENATDPICEKNRYSINNYDSRVIRGGSYTDEPELATYLRASYRNCMRTTVGLNYVGFRLAKTG